MTKPLVTVTKPILKPSLPKTKGSLVTQSQVFTNWIAKNSLNKAHFTSSMLILYGSQSGKSKDMAERLCKLGQYMELFVSCCCIKDYSFDRLHTMKMVVVVTSTYGHGEPPENAVAMYNWLSEMKGDVLKETKFAVLKVGSSVYSEPFAFGNFVENGMKRLGATCVNVGKIDEIRYSDDEDFNQFAYGLFSSVDAPKDALLRTKSLGFFDSNVVKSKYKLVMDETNAVPQLSVNGAYLVEVMKNDKITKDPQNEIYKMEVKNSANLRFEVGDEMVVWLQNSDTEVKNLIARLGFPGSSMFRLEQDDSTVSLPNWATTPTNLSHLLTHHLDLNAVSPSMLKFFALHAKEQKEQDKLTELATTSNAKFAMQNLAILDVLELFPSIRLSPDQLPVFLGLLKDLRPRYYSIASSPNHSKGIIRITYKLVRYDNSVKRREGVCSSFLASRKEKDSIYIKIQTSTFRIPDDPAVPIIMIGAGTGVSPFIGFTEERQAQKTMEKNVGKSTFVYGCSTRDSMIESEFWEKSLMNGVLDSVITAFSKETSQKVYVQDQIEANFDKLWQMIEEGAYVYSCGDVKVGTAVKEAITNAIAKKNKWTTVQAADYVKKMVTGKRYHRSEWGLQENPHKTIKTARFRLWAKSVFAMVRWMNVIKAKKAQ